MQQYYIDDNSSNSRTIHQDCHLWYCSSSSLLIFYNIYIYSIITYVYYYSISYILMNLIIYTLHYYYTIPLHIQILYTSYNNILIPPSNASLYFKQFYFLLPLCTLPSPQQIIIDYLKLFIHNFLQTHNDMFSIRISTQLNNIFLYIS